MQIRQYQAGDEVAQAQIYNIAAGRLPAFKPATADEIARRYRMADFDAASKLYAEQNGQVVGYAVFSLHGRISHPWCLPGFESQAQPALLEAVLAGLEQRGIPRAWAAYRADWEPVGRFFEQHGFSNDRSMINFVAPVERLPRSATVEHSTIAPLVKEDIPELLALGGDCFQGETLDDLTGFFWENRFFDPDAAFVLRAKETGRILAAGMAIVQAAYADPTKIDASMPCFRLGTFGTERERHKRVNGQVGCVFRAEPGGEAMLAEAASRLKLAGVRHASAQAASDDRTLCALYDRYFERSGAFPIYARSLER